MRRNQLKSLSKLADAGAAVAEALGSERFEWQTVQIFLTICTHGGEIAQAEIERITGWAQSAVSRNVAKLGAGLTINDAGARLVESFEDPTWRRRKIVRLTARGKQLRDRLSELIAN
jgi:DNA-binding MarR family transcriptional regulator